MLLRLCFCLFVGLAGFSFAELHVSPEGKPDGEGSKDSPLGSLKEARDRIREMKKAGKLPPGPFTVWVHGGTYEITDTFQLDPQDSGSEGNPIIYRAVDGEKPLLIGAVKVGDFVPHQGSILKADLKDTGVPDKDVKQLLFKGERQPLARYPNFDTENPLYGGWAFLKDVPPGKTEGHAWKREGYLDAKDVRKWARPEEVEMNLFAGYGWWNYIMPVASLDEAERKVKLAKDCGYDLHPNNRYFFQNALEELDAPGEWYIDQKSRTLYFWPPAPIDSSEVRVPVIGAFIKASAGTKFVTIRGLSFTGSNGTAVSFSETDHCTVAGCTIRHVGYWSGSGIAISGTNNLVTGNEISHTGSNGISIGGGDRLTLKPANNVADNNHVHHPGVIQKNGPGIGLSGVGNKVTHNHIHHTPRMAIQFSGNNLVIEYNHLHHTVLETQDGGAVYTGGRDWISSRGTTLKYNFIHDTIGVGQSGEGLKWPHFTWGIYMDDNAGGLDIVGNIVARSARAAIHLHNGRDHVIRNNIFVDGGERQVEYGGWSANHPFYKNHIKTMVEGWDKVKDQPEWKKLRNMDFDPRNAVRPDGTIMSGNIATKNIIAWKDPSVRYADLRLASAAYNIFDENIVWNGGKEIDTAVILTGKDTGPELLNAEAGFAAATDGKPPKGWGWNHKPRKDLKLFVDAEKVLHIEAATSDDPKNAKVATYSPSLPVKPGAAYRTRMKIKGTEPGMRLSFTYAIFSAGNGYWQTDAKGFTLTTEWQEIEVPGAMLKDNDTKWKPWMKTFFLRADLADSKGEVLIKDLTVHEAEALDGWESWKAQGWDQHSIIADPLFENREKDDYRLKTDSPAFKLGFERIPVEKIGQYESEFRAR